MYETVQVDYYYGEFGDYRGDEFLDLVIIVRSASCSGRRADAAVGGGGAG